MSEEEKFKRYLRMLNEENSIDKKEEAMLGLLGLYNELKEKNASLQKEIKLMKSININDNYISKDKIRELLKKYEKTNIEDYQAIIRFYKDLEKLLKE